MSNFTSFPQFSNLILDFCVKTRTRFSLRDKRLFEIIEVEITRVDCNMHGLVDMALMQQAYDFIITSY